ncbi:ABC transporter ATP-binding protein [Prosthecomicrobium pneumaticum]|uniref:NitT/TauT family transport system ATP-binding protein n=1 Tax=Prosthecomicrobium pneumaticum TaxID=81895 RepID=A0A7W9CWC3_9HYPH|nr:ABC transporter ATP-binding protein [Prosthecomicrobium pneumaticum]MBB5752761.1 NitT/TauT family transport system ATP-binding protein [Prosthecomicrobium pneumaticum]
MDAVDDPNAKLTVRQATKIYRTASGDLVAIDRCNLDVRAREIVSIVGPSGCGKTTLLWSMSGLHGLTAGEVRLDGKPITGPNPEIGMVFQDANLLPWRNLDSNIAFPFEIKGGKPDRAWVDHLMHRVGLDGFGAKMPRELSGGMQQRAALVRALSFKPSVLLMDEPFGALDSFTREEMNRLVEEIWMETPTTIVLITHSIEEAVFLSDRVVVMSPRPGRVASIHPVPFPRPRSIEIMTTREVFDLMTTIKLEIVGERKSLSAPKPAAPPSAALDRAAS